MAQHEQEPGSSGEIAANPSEAPETKPKRKFSGVARAAAGRTVRTALIVSTVSAPFAFSGLMGWKSREYLLPNPEPVNISNKPLEIDPTKITSEERRVLPRAINVYFAQKQADEALFEQFLLYNPSEVIVALGQNAAHDYLARAVTLLQLSVGQEKAKFINNDGKILLIDNRQFELSDQYQSHLATAIIDQSLETLLSKDQAGKLDQLANQLDLLYWLKDQNFNIQFENDSFIFFSPEKIVTLARALQFIHQDTPKPTLIQFYRAGDPRYLIPKEAAGAYACGYSQIPAGPLISSFKYLATRHWNCPILISNTIATKGIAHEIGHHTGFNSQNLNQEDFKKKIRPLEQQLSTQIRHKPDIYLSEHAASNNEEDYAETLAWYIAKGQEFRQLIKQMRWWNPAAALIIQEKYNFFKEKFAGQQTSRNGILIKSTNERDTLIEDMDMKQVKIGNKFRIRDMSPSPLKELGVHLRRDPADFGSTDESLTIFDGDRVEIIDGPAVFNQWAYVWWKVGAESKGKILQGWLANEWLGDQIREFENE